MNYIVTFKGYIDQRKRPENFPNVVEDVLAVSFDTGQDLVAFVNARIFMYAKNAGMGVSLNPGAMEDLSIVDTNRIWVPMHMITHMTAVYKTILQELPEINAAGVTMLPSGKEIVKH